MLFLSGQVQDSEQGFSGKVLVYQAQSPGLDPLRHRKTNRRRVGGTHVIKKMNHCELLAAPGEDPLYFSNFAEVVLQDGSVVEVVGDVLALDGCEL